MLRTIRTSLFLFLMLAALAATPALAGGAMVKLMNQEGMGNYLVDGKGMTLYYFAKDTPGMSACTGGCLEKWPPLKADMAEPEAGLMAKDFGILNGQVTFRGYPLYYFAQDAKPGDAKGHKVGGVWFAVDPAHFPPMTK
jgi:predicted lipoprotein with Yx(FWY)xxD motif